MHLYLVRHGQTASNLDHALDTAEPGAPLTESGQQQAVALVEAFAGRGIGVVVSSTLTRAWQTAAPLARALGLEVLRRPGVREVPAGDLELRTDDEARRIYREVAFGWAERRPGSAGATMPGTDLTGRSFLAGYDEVVAETAALTAEAGADAAVIVSHGTAIRVWCAARALNVEVDFAHDHPLPNTAVVALEGEPGVGWLAADWDGVALGVPALE